MKTGMSAPPVVGLFQSVTYLAKLPESTLEALAAVAVERTYRVGEVIFWHGEPAYGLYVIGDGCVKICRHSTDGREHILHILQRGETFNDVAALDGGDNPATAIAHADATIWVIPRTDLMHTTERHPDLAWALLEDMARRARYLVNMVEDLAMRSVKGRLARLLLEQATKNDSEALPRLLTQEEMANQLGTVREVVGRALRSLANSGVIEFDRHRIVILDVDRLAEEATA